MADRSWARAEPVLDRSLADGEPVAEVQGYRLILIGNRSLDFQKATNWSRCYFPSRDQYCQMVRCRKFWIILYGYIDI